jgi:hypothetical protein
LSAYGSVSETGLSVLAGSLVGAVRGTGTALLGVYALTQSENGMEFAVGSPTGFIVAALVGAVASACWQLAPRPAEWCG